MQRISMKSCGILAKRNIYHGPPPFARPPGAPEPKIGKILYFLSPFILATGATVYAQQNEYFRKHIVNSVLKCALDEKEFDHVSKQINGLFKIPNVTQTGTQTSNIEETIKLDDTVAKRVMEIEQDVEQQAALVLKEYQNAIELSKNFNEILHRVTDDAIDHIDPSLLANLKYKISLRDIAISKAERIARDAEYRISKYDEALNKSVVAGNTDEIRRLRNKIQANLQYISKAKHELNKEEEIPVKNQKYGESIEKTRNFFANEIAAVFPDLNLAEKRRNLSQEDFDIFIAHAYSQALVHKKEMQFRKYNVNTEDKVKAQFDYESELERHKKFLDNKSQMKSLNIREETERRLLEQMKKKTIGRGGDGEYWEEYKWLMTK